MGKKKRFESEQRTLPPAGFQNNKKGARMMKKKSDLKEGGSNSEKPAKPGLSKENRLAILL